jgi:hypothetical protein
MEILIEATDTGGQKLPALSVRRWRELRGIGADALGLGRGLASGHDRGH